MKRAVIALILLSLIFVMGASGCKTTPDSGTTCPATSNPPCHSASNGVGVSGVIVKYPCECPSDTEYSGTTDVVTPGGPYLICNCK